MKTRLLSLVLLSLGFLPLVAQTAKPAPSAPVKAKAEAKKTDAKKEEPKIEGIVLTRPGGGFLGLKLEGGTFKLSFYDMDKKAAPADYPRALARWNPNYKLGSERVMLNQSADGKSLLGGKPVRPPYAFKLYLTLLRAEAATEVDTAAPEPNTEAYVVDFHA